MRRIIVGILEHDRDVARPAQLEEFVVAEAVVARLDRVAQRDAVERLGKQVDEAGDIVAVEFSARRELPQDRPELGPERGEALGEEIADAFGAFGQACERITQKREPLIANWKPSGAVFPHVSQLFGLWRP